MAVDTRTLCRVADEFVGAVDTCFGLYLDCSQGFRQNRDQMAKDQLSALGRFPNTPGIKSVEDLDGVEYFVAPGSPNDPATILYHRCTQGEFKERNTPSGKNDLFIGRYCIVWLYECWESEYRDRLAHAVDLTREDLRHDVFGDLRYLRNAIIHNQGLATRECERLRVLMPIAEGTEICLKGQDLYDVSRTIKAFVDDLLRSHTGKDPAYSTIWHLR